MNNHRYDAVIVGARCAGAATAMLLARSGLKVLAIDRADYAADTLSTHALMRGGVLQLHRWGVLDDIRNAGTPPIRSVTFQYRDEALAIPIAERYGVDALFAPRRTVIDRVLVDRARDAGAEVRYRLRVVDLLYSVRGHVNGIVVVDADGHSHRIMADVVIGADGLRSTVARLVDVEPYRVGRHASGLLYAYWPGVDLDGYHWYWADGAAAGAVPTNDGLTCVFVAIPAARFRTAIQAGVETAYRRLLAHAAPQFYAGLRGDPTGFHSFSGQTGLMRPSWGPGWALVGDAGCFRDPLTAHGMTDALRDAERLAHAIADGSPEAFADYQRERDAVSRELFELSDQVASFAWDMPAIRRLNEELAKQMSAEVKMIVRNDSVKPALRSSSLVLHPQ
jgi:2-polyprenyl-6-methoxyphenol hydroxylase-like FAD-dependent oxidoreductase